MKKRLLSILSIFACLFALSFIFVASPVNTEAAGQEVTADMYSFYTEPWIEAWFAGDYDSLMTKNTDDAAAYGMESISYETTAEDYNADILKAGEFKEFGESTCDADNTSIVINITAKGTKSDVLFTWSLDMTTYSMKWEHKLMAPIVQAMDADSIEDPEQDYEGEAFSAYTDAWINAWTAGDLEGLTALNADDAKRYGMNKIVYEAEAEDYKEIVESAGAVKELEAPNFERLENGYQLTQKAVCENKTVVFLFTVNGEKNTITCTADIELTGVELVIKACLNTIMGMGTVFVVLIFISFIISLFKLMSGGKKKKETPVPAAAPAAAPQAEVVSDDDEIVAVIAAAIAAYEADCAGYGEVPADGLVVRSIKKRGFAN